MKALKEQHKLELNKKKFQESRHSLSDRTFALTKMVEIIIHFCDTFCNKQYQKNLNGHYTVIFIST